MGRSSEVVIALGSNLGDRASHLWLALQGLKEHGIKVLRHSALYETNAAYVVDQPPFLNAALLATTELEPMQVLPVLEGLQAKAGRQAGGVRFGPRPLDLDIIFYGGMKLQHERLTIPHPRWRERSFVKAPVADLYLPSEQGAATPSRRSVMQELREVHDAWLADRSVKASGGGSHQLPLLPKPGREGAPGSTPEPPGPRLPEGQGDVMRRVAPLPGGRMISWGCRSHVMGILNATPDSFSDGGRLMGAGGTTDLEVALAVARGLARDGADVIDVGGQSTRPGSARVSEQEEAARVIPLIRAMRQDPQLKTCVLSCDTYYASVAREAVTAGVDVINDVSGGTLDPGMLAQVADLGVPYVLMHMRGDLASMQHAPHTRYESTWRDVGAELMAGAARAMAAGIPAWNIILDPGIGFAKTIESNLEIIRNLGDMRLGALAGPFQHGPLLVGPSRKGFLGSVTGRQEAAQRDAATVAAAVACVAGGGLADILRVHNVRDVRDGLLVADALYRHNPG